MLETAVESDQSFSFAGLCVCVWTEKAANRLPASLKHFWVSLCMFLFLILFVLFQTEGPEVQSVFNI